MTTTLFLQSEIEDPYKLYKTMLKKNPIYWDSSNKLWAVYSYENCKTILSSYSAQIPPGNTNQLNEYALLIFGKLARVSNGADHDSARNAAELLVKKMNAVPIKDILEKLINKGSDLAQLDWVNAVCKKIAVLSVLKSFDFSERDC